MTRAEISQTTKALSKKWLRTFPKLLNLPQDARGIPIPANVHYSETNGRPIFAVTRVETDIELLRSQKCSVTGSTMNERDVWFVTTPDLAFVPFGLFMDAPMCGEAKEFTLRVCPYFGMPNYHRLSDKQATAMVPELSAQFQNVPVTPPSEFVAVQVTGFHVEFTAQGLRYLPNRQYVRAEFWRERKCQKVKESDEIRAEIEKGLIKALDISPYDAWPKWAASSIDGSLDGKWPW